jgi:hypothetical protein
MPALRLRLFLSLLALLMVACATDGAGGDRGEPEAVTLSRASADLETHVPPEFAPVLEMVIAALEDGEEVVAESALRRLLARQPTGRALEIARGLERILDGRRLASTLDLSLEAVEEGEVNGRYTLTLIARQHGETEVVFRPGAARLRESLVVVNPDGHEHRNLKRLGIPFPEELRIPPEGEVRLVLVDVQLPAPPGLLAVAVRLRFTFLPGRFVEPDGRLLPAQSVEVKDVELVRLASFLPTAPVDPAELEAYVREGQIFVPSLMERAVRIPPSLREEALDLLAPHIEAMSLVELELLIPALRWLSRTVRPAGDPGAWRRWSEQRQLRRAERPPSWERVELPGTLTSD